ncbi:UPF0764 protein C16orf89 homolog [Engystomops pustulosus]|uniref:UPF0764 protein C16orf89 homolog n=1 Tax=Engystomops pustulosus TaxID=76066 RepID=UPI003AFAA120
MRLLLLLVSLGLFTPSTTNTETAVRSALSAIEKAIQLLQNEYKEINLDGMFGFRLLSEEIKGTLERLDAEKDPYLFTLMDILNNALNEALNKTSYSVQKMDPKYYEEFQEFLQGGFWIPPTSWKQTSPGLVYSELADDSSYYIQDYSDQCISALMGNRKENKEPCVVTAPCLKAMTREDLSDYSLSHQLLFFLIGKMKHCRNDLFVKDIDYYEDLYCANMMNGNLNIERNGYPQEKRDLFMENILLCGLSGFSDFYKPEWLNQIISWQDPVTGCYGEIGNNVSSANTDNENHAAKRVKRGDRSFLGTCHSHMIGMAVGALGGFLYSSTFM